MQVQVASGIAGSASTCTSGGQNKSVKVAFCGSACAFMARVCWRALLASVIRKKNFCGCGEDAAATVAWFGLLVAVKAGVEVAGADRRLSWS